MKIAFIDHPLHRQTRSSDFFIKLLEIDHEVSVYYPGSQWRFVLEEVINSNCDLAICWQHEFFAPPIAAQGIRTIIIPMYDGSGNMPAAYWRFFARLGIESINFSANLNQQHLVAGIKSSYVKFYPDPEDFEPVEDFSSLRGFLWQRRPEHLLHWQTVMRLTCGQLRSLHVHQVPDSLPPLDLPEFRNWPLLAASITESKWFETQADFFQVLKLANVFIAPRLSEGIGLALLEAMAQGQCVIAHSASTHNEYIQDGKNGLLFTLHDLSPIDLSTAATLGKKARESIKVGFQNWIDDQAIIKWKIEKPGTKEAGAVSSHLEKIALSFPAAYFKGANFLFTQLGKIRSL